MIAVVDPLLIFGLLDVEELSVMFGFLSLGMILYFQVCLDSEMMGLLVGLLRLLLLDLLGEYLLHELQFLFLFTSIQLFVENYVS